MLSVVTGIKTFLGYDASVWPWEGTNRFATVAAVAANMAAGAFVDIYLNSGLSADPGASSTWGQAAAGAGIALGASVLADLPVACAFRCLFGSADGTGANQALLPK